MLVSSSVRRFLGLTRFPRLRRIYKVFDLKNYTMLYKVSDKNVQEIKISPGIMLLIYNRKEGYVPLKILSIDTGEVRRLAATLAPLAPGGECVLCLLVLRMSCVTRGNFPMRSWISGWLRYRS